MQSNTELREALAAYAHDAWSGWMNYLLSKSTVNADGSWTIPATSAERWYRQMSTPYHLLPEGEQQSDLHEADRMLALFAESRAAALLRAVEWLGARRDVADVPPFGAMRGEEIHLMPIQGSEEWAAASGGKLTSYCNTLADTIVALAKGLGYTEEPAP